MERTFVVPTFSSAPRVVSFMLCDNGALNGTRKLRLNYTAFVSQHKYATIKLLLLWSTALSLVLLGFTMASAEWGGGGRGKV